MRYVVIGFEVHQPFRIRRDFFWNPRADRDLIERYFDSERNREIFERVKRKCYLPATGIILEEIQSGENEGREVKFFFSISGTFVEQAEKWGKDLLELLQQLSYTHKVEFLGQTYYHSVTSLWEDPTEWREQVKLHRDLMKSVFGSQPETIENTELITNRRVAEEVESMGFKVMLMEGKEKVLRGKSPNYVYRLRGGKLSLLPRNYRLSDDIAFRFSSRDWEQYPLTAEKFAEWIRSSTGHLGLVFVDYETFGEHHWPESGILEFLRWLPRELNRKGVRMRIPREISGEEYDELELTEDYSSWADIDKDETSWLGNQMQWAYDETVRRAEMPSKELGGDFLRAWRYLTTSDHYYYMFMGHGGPAEVHSYFSAFSSATEAFINEFYATNQFLWEELKLLNSPGVPFVFRRNGRPFAVIWNERELKEVESRDPETYKKHEKYIKEWIR
jgi:alpha-amylase